MDKGQMIKLVERYFAAVDGENFNSIAATLTEDCVFAVETHGVELKGLVEIEGMFRRLWDDYAAVAHRGFVHVPDPEAGRIAVRFQVVNTHYDGSKIHKSNCNFFEVEGGRFGRVAVYMAGDNTLTSG